jgi:hypothetical protein
MQTFSTKASAIAYAKERGWTEADANRAFEGLALPIDAFALLNIMVRFAGPVMLKRQRAQGAQRGVVTTRNREIETLSSSFSGMVKNYEDQIESDRSAFIPIVKTLYSFAKPFGYHSAWIEALLATYRKYTADHQTSTSQKKAA